MIWYRRADAAAFSCWGSWTADEFQQDLPASRLHLPAATLSSREEEAEIPRGKPKWLAARNWR
jgi:hypothetical protein